MKSMADSMRARFLRGFWDGIKIVWPILSGLLGFMAALGIGVALLEGWRLGDGLYFAFVSGLTIGYGDLVPKAPLARTLAITIGFTGILLTGLVAAVGVQALQAALRGSEDR
jgi:Ion channel